MQSKRILRKWQKQATEEDSAKIQNHLVHVWVLRQLLPHGSTAGHHVEDARGKARLGADLGKEEGGESGKKDEKRRLLSKIRESFGITHGRARGTNFCRCPPISGAFVLTGDARCNWGVTVRVFRPNKNIIKSANRKVMR